MSQDKARTHHYTQRINKLLDQYLPSPQQAPERLHHAMRYSVLNGGKRIRPLLSYATAEMLHLPPESVDVPAVSLELIHAYSLIHDDLPAMDDDDLRRGLPTCHKKFDEATAILAGDALQSLAFYLLANLTKNTHNAEQRLSLIELLSAASGSFGMAGGQALDLASTGLLLLESELEIIHQHKTGALIRSAVLMAWHSTQEQNLEIFYHLDQYSQCIGLAFQVRDDILDIESDTLTLGKQQGKDIADNKATYPAILGIKAAKAKTRQLCDQAIKHLHCIEDIQPPKQARGESLLHYIAHYIVKRVS